MHSAKEPMGDALSYRDRLPLSWTPLSAPPEGLEIERLAESNLRLLASVALLAEHSPSKDEPTAADLELQRIHHKLNLLLELLGSFLLQQLPRPPAVSLRLSWRGLAWAGGGDAEVGSAGMIEIYLSPVLPQPLRLPAHIVACNAGETVAEFDPMPEFCQAALERHVFQQHRREVAETRQPPKHGV